MKVHEIGHSDWFSGRCEFTLRAALNKSKAEKCEIKGFYKNDLNYDTF